MMRIPLLILLLSLSALNSMGRADSSSSGFLIGLELQQSMDRGSSFLLPTLEWEKGLHRAGLGGVLGLTHIAKAGSRGSKWVRTRQVFLRGLSLTYDLRVWQASERVSLRAGLSGYYFHDAYSHKKGEEDPFGTPYSHDQKAVRRSLSAAPSMAVAFDVGSGFSLALGVQPIRYGWSHFRWEGKGVNRGSKREHSFLLQNFEVKYRL
jgi:hypothetical protein